MYLIHNKISDIRLGYKFRIKQFLCHNFLDDDAFILKGNLNINTLINEQSETAADKITEMYYVHNFPIKYNNLSMFPELCFLIITYQHIAFLLDK